MKKRLQICVIVVLAVALVCTAFAFKGPGSSMAGGTICPMVGWHTASIGSSGCGGSSAGYQVLAFDFMYLPGWGTNNVGWHGG